MRRALGLALLAGMVLPRATPCQQDDFPRVAPETAGLSLARLREAMDSVRAWIAQERILGAIVLVLRDGRIVWEEAAGWSDRERAVPMRVGHVVSMRSMTKPLVGTAALMLVEEGKLRLEDPVARYLPSFDHARSRAITIFQLLTHTSGITGEIYNDREGTRYTSLREAVDAVGAKGPEFPSGTRYSYSDPGSSTLGAVIAQVSGMPAEDLIQRRILDPLGMRDSYLLLPLDHPARPGVAATYRREDGRWVRYWDRTLPTTVPFFRASGGLWSTARDYARFMTMWLQHGRYGARRFLDSATVARAIEPHSAYVYPADSLRSRYRFYGLHWSVISDRHAPVPPPFATGTFEHGGSDGTLAWADPSRRLIIVYLTQSRAQDTRNAFLRLIHASLK